MILIVGVTRRVGREVCQRVQQRGGAVRGLVRPGSVNETGQAARALTWSVTSNPQSGSVPVDLLMRCRTQAGVRAKPLSWIVRAERSAHRITPE
jgi:nucleoside-diphosphate-sugar epimerase